jgi:hypothetical protein
VLSKPHANDGQDGLADVRGIPVAVFSDLTEACNCVRARIAEPEGVQEEGRVFDSGYV